MDRAHGFITPTKPTCPHELHPLSMQMLGMHGAAYANLAVQAADLIVAIGSRFGLAPAYRGPSPCLAFGSSLSGFACPVWFTFLHEIGRQRYCPNG